MSTKVLKISTLSQVERQAQGEFGVVLYDATELDRDNETIDLTNVRAREPLTLQVDHDRSVLKTVGQVRDIAPRGKRLRGTLTFAPEGVSEIADQVRRQVEAGITSTVSIGFLGQIGQAPEGHVIWKNVEVLELSFVSVPASPGARVDGKALRQWLGRRDPDEPRIETVLDLAADNTLLEFRDEDFRPALRAGLADAFARARLNSARLAGLTEPTFELDARQVASMVGAAVRAGLRAAVEDAVARELRRVHGRLD